MSERSPLPAAVIERALKPWELEVFSCELASLSENIVYRVRAREGEFALRIHRPGYNSLNELNSELLWSGALNDSGIATPPHRTTRSGEHYIELAIGSGDRRAVGLIEWLPGQTLHELIESASETDAIQHYRSLGRLIARLHDQASKWQLPSHFERRMWDEDGLVGLEPLWGKFWEAQVLRPPERSLLKTARDRVYDELRAIEKTPADFSLIHADLHPHNVLVSGTELHAIDFDDCGFGWHVYDIAVALHEVAYHKHFVEFEHALMDGYRTIRDSESGEMHRQLPLFYLVRTLVSLGWISARPELASTEEIRPRMPRILNEVESYLASS